jgi:hypothetical protein
MPPNLPARTSQRIQGSPLPRLDERRVHGAAIHPGDKRYTLAKIVDVVPLAGLVNAKQRLESSLRHPWR